MRLVHKTIAGIALLVSAILIFGGVGHAGSVGDRDAVLATIGARKITEREVDQRVRERLNTIEAEIYEVREHAIEGIAAEQLIQQAADRAHLSVTAYLKREIDDKIPDPSEAQVRMVYQGLSPQLHRSYEDEKPAIIALIKDRQKPEARQNLVARLRNETPFKILLPPPRFYVPAGSHPALGPANAPVTIVEFGDFECPFTRKAEDTLKQVLHEYGPKIRLVYIDHPLPIHKHAVAADGAARCANEQGKFWEYHNALFADQSKLTPDDLRAAAAKLKLDIPKFNACFDHSKYDSDLVKDSGQALALRVEGTPTFYVNGRVLFGAASLQDFEDVINRELGSSPNGKVTRAGD